MKIVVIVRTLNEETNIAEFCDGHKWADQILIADGGSTDNTKGIAGLFDNVKVRDFEQRHYLPNGLFMNPEPAHINYLIDWANCEGTDWIVLDDADSWPTPALQRDARKLIESTYTDYVMLTRLYLWGEDQYLPKINEGGGPCLWAWRAEMGIRWADGLTMFDTVAPIPNIGRALILEPPYADLHHFSRNYETKRARYAAWGHPQQPIEGGIYWPPEPLPEWTK